MKAKGFMRILSVFITGLVLCGVGAGACIVEWSQMKITEGADESVNYEQVYKLPEGEPLYFDHSSEIVKTDENVNEGEMIFTVNYSEYYTFDFQPVTRFKLAEFEKDGTHKEWTVKGLSMPSYNRNDDAPGDFDYFKDILEHLKSKEIYIHTYSRPNYTVSINPKDRERVVCVWDHKNLMLADIDADIDAFVSNRDDDDGFDIFDDEDIDDDDFDEDMEEYENDMNEMHEDINEMREDFNEMLNDIGAER